MMTPEPKGAPREHLTERLCLRPWRAQDKAPFAAMGADPEVMRFFPALLSRAESDALADRCNQLVHAQGWGFWALARRDSGEFVGMCGLHRPAANLPFSPCVEVGWRLARAHWHQGLASEAARASLAVAFDELGLDEVVAFTTVGNQPSQAVMQRLGMARDPADDFEHPALPEGHPLRPHVLYRLSKPAYRAGRPPHGA